MEINDILQAARMAARDPNITLTEALKSLCRHRSTSDDLGFYVYGWFAGDDLLYIGKGSGNRAFERGQHNDVVEELRDDAGDTFRVDIFEAGMREDIAYRVETCLIRILQPLGNLVGTAHDPPRGRADDQP